MAPFAAEHMKYGKSVVSDPRRSMQLLEVLGAVQMSEKRDLKTANILTNSKNDNSENIDQQGDNSMLMYSVPIDIDDRKALLLWAYSEAVSLLRQYGDLLQGVNSYLSTGTSTVGECVMLVEDELR